MILQFDTGEIDDAIGDHKKLDVLHTKTLRIAAQYLERFCNGRAVDISRCQTRVDRRLVVDQKMGSIVKLRDLGSSAVKKIDILRGSLTREVPGAALTRYVHNLCRDMVGQEARRHENARRVEFRQDEPATDDPTDLIDNIEWLHTKLAQLDPVARKAIELYYFSDKAVTQSEAADELGVSRRAFQRLLTHARRRLRDSYASEMH